MSYKTLLVHLQCGQSNHALLKVAGQFADRFKAHVFGISACQPMMVVSGDGTVCGEVYANDQQQITADLDRAQTEFRDALTGKSTWLEWRSEITLMSPASYLSIHARSADLIMTGSLPADTLGLSRSANSGTIVLEAGRPVYIVPAEARPMLFQGALVGWKDTRECRRALADAIPLLQQCERVTIIEIAAIDDLDAAQARVDAVMTWLERHGVMAGTRIEPSKGNDAEQLRAAADTARADFIVAGAYGHSRLREWVIGGVTRDLLLDCRHGVLTSH